MAGISKIHSDNKIKLYRTFSYRDENNKPQNQRKLIGVLDIDTNKPIFNKYFMRLIASQGISIEQINNIKIEEIPKIVNFGSFTKEELLNKHFSFKNQDLNNVNDEYNQNKDSSVNDLSNKENINSNSENIKICSIVINENNKYLFNESQYSVLNFGPQVLLEKIVLETNLLNLLKKIFPDKWSKILTLSYFLVAKDKPLMYCQDWVEKNENYLINSNLSSQRVSELLSEIKYSEIMQFYESWSSSFIEDEYLALDITSISSYSNLINHVEAGYNRDGENLEQVNICLLFGQKSGLPVYSSLYSGSLNDVTIFKSFIEQVEFFNQKKYNLVMDKGFYSANNIKTLLKKYLKYNFLISVPFTTLLSRQIVSNSLEKFEKNSIIKIGEDLLFSYSKIEKLNNIDSVKYHIFYNENLKHQIKFNLTKKLSK